MLDITRLGCQILKILHRILLIFLKKILDEIGFLFENYETDSDSNFFVGLFHIFLWGGSFLIMMFTVVMFVMFVLIFFKTGFEVSRSFPILYISIGAIFTSYVMKKLRVRLFYKNEK